MRIIGNLTRVIAATAVAAALLFSMPAAIGAQAPGNPSADKLSEALANTRDKGVATLAVFHAPEEPASVKLAGELSDGPWTKANRGLIQVVCVSKSTHPDVFASQGITRFPTIVLFGRTEKGIGCLTTITDCDTVDAVVTRISGYNLGLASVPSTVSSDPSVSPANFLPDVRASNQYPSPPPATTPAPPPTQTPAPPPAAPAPPTAPPTGYATAPAGLIQLPSQNLVIHQAPPQIVLAPTQAPIVYIPQMVSQPMAAPVAQPTPNVFLPAPAPPPMMAVAAPAPAPVAAAPAAPAATGGVALNSQMLAMPTLGNTTRVRVRGPGILAMGLANLGERLTRLGRARIETVQSTDLQSPYAQSNPAGLATFSTTSATPYPIMAQPPAQPTAPPATAPPAAPPTTPSPQAEVPRKHSLFGR